VTGFRIFLIIALVSIVAYTLVVASHHGWNLIPLFFDEIGRMTWQGQFNVDFSFFLLLSGLWIAWRDRFSPASIILGIVGVFGGMLFLSVYLLVLSVQARGDIAAVLLGRRSAI